MALATRLFGDFDHVAKKQRLFKYGLRLIWRRSCWSGVYGKMASKLIVCFTMRNGRDRLRVNILPCHAGKAVLRRILPKRKKKYE
jgi:hypothetical protein